MSTQTVRASSKTKISKANKNNWRTTVAFWGFVGPLVVGLFVFAYVPVIWSFILSFFQARYTLTPQKFVGLENYGDLLSDKFFWESVLNVLIYALVIVPTIFSVALGLALLLNNIKFARTFFRAIFFMPITVSYVTAAIIWRMNLFSGVPSGFANIALDWLGKDPVVWIGPGVQFWVVLLSMRVWVSAGFFMIIFLAALQDIPRSLYEAAYIDGAEPGWTTFWHITFPMLRNASIAVLLLNLISAFQAFAEFYTLLSSPQGSSANLTLLRTPLTYIYQVAITDQNYGQANAGAFLIALAIIVITVSQGRLLGFGRAEHER